MLLGLTGGYCAGKNAVAALLEARGWTTIDVDRTGHRALELAKDAVVARFGAAMLDAGGALDRKALGALLFSDPALLAEHEAIVHPRMFGLVDEEIRRLGAEAGSAAAARIVVNAAILYKMPQAADCDLILEVRAPLFLRLARAWSRDRIPPLRALERIRRQEGLWTRRRESGRRVVFLSNSGSLAGLSRRLGRLLDKAGM